MNHVILAAVCAAALGLSLAAWQTVNSNNDDLRHHAIGIRGPAGVPGEGGPPGTTALSLAIHGTDGIASFSGFFWPDSGVGELTVSGAVPATGRLCVDLPGSPTWCVREQTFVGVQTQGPDFPARVRGRRLQCDFACTSPSAFQVMLPLIRC